MSPSTLITEAVITVKWLRDMLILPLEFLLISLMISLKKSEMRETSPTELRMLKILLKFIILSLELYDTEISSCLIFNINIIGNFIKKATPEKAPPLNLRLSKKTKRLG